MTAPDPGDVPAQLAGRVAKVLAVLAIIVTVAAGGAWLAPRLAESVAGEPAEASLAAGEEVDIAVSSGSTARAIGSMLEEAGVVGDAGGFASAVRSRGVADQLKAGDYTFTGGMTIDSIIDELVTGPPAPDTFRLTVIEGLRIDEMLASLSAQSGHAVEEFEELLLDGTITSSLLPDNLPEGTPPLTAWEGLLFPATYEFVADASPQRILRSMAAELEDRVRAIDWSNLEDLGMTPYDGLIIASLIEKEAKLEDDRPLIASVIVNRLNDEMRLQIDATVIYALGENPGRVMQSHLQVDSPWNTYRNGGLPPTPIGGVRATSLQAAASPAVTDYLFYVLVDTDGRHGFSETLDEHNDKVAQARRDGVLQ